jgi:hypothetical protein
VRRVASLSSTAKALRSYASANQKPPSRLVIGMPDNLVQYRRSRRLSGWGAAGGSSRRDARLNAPPGQPGTPGGWQRPDRPSEAWAVVEAARSRVEGRFAEYPNHQPAPSPSSPCPTGACRPGVPCVRWDEAAIGTTFVSAPLRSVVERDQRGRPELALHARRFPGREPSPASRGAALSAGQRTPLGATRTPRISSQVPTSFSTTPAGRSVALSDRRYPSTFHLALSCQVAQRPPKRARTTAEHQAQVS